MGSTCGDVQVRGTVTVTDDILEDIPPLEVQPPHSDNDEMAPPEEHTPYYPSVDQFVEQFLVQIYDRPLGHGLTWCSEWWKHAEANFYLTALWHSWEGLRASGEATAMATWSVQFLFPIMDRLLSERGPFAGCQPADGQRRGEHRDESAPHPGRVLPTTAPPPGLFDERP